MNNIAGPATGLDMLLLFADANPANGGSVAGDDAFATFEEALAGNIQPQKSSVGEVAPDEVAPGDQPTIRRERERTPVCALPMDWGDLSNAPAAIEQLSVIRDLHEVCYAASELEGQSTVGEVDALPVLVEVPPSHSAQPQISGAHSDEGPSTAEAQSNPSSTPDDVGKLLRDAKIDVRSISQDDFAKTLTEVRLPAESTRIESVRPTDLGIHQLRDAVIKAVKPHVVVRVPHALAESQAQGRAKGTKELADKSNQSSTALDSTSFEPSTQPSAGEVELPVAAVSAPTLVDELSADAGQFDSKRDEIVVELNIPDWGMLEIEVIRDGDDTEVSLLADPAVNQLIRDHLPELTEALAASGIELAGLDVRQQNHEHQAGEGRDVFLPVELNSGGSGDDAQLAAIATRTGLSRYRLMSITA